jgi:nucleoside-diphosphate-sugar epimerase
VNQNIKKILILGANGFIGKSLSQLLNKDKYKIAAFNRQGLDATNFSELKRVLEIAKFDYVINCCLSGEGRLLKQDTPQNFFENLQIQENLLQLSNLYSKLIIFGSGAEFDRTKDVQNRKEGEFGPPTNNYYGLAKYINSRRVFGNDKVINIYIFNVFGPLEKDNRFIKSSIIKAINFETVEIWGDAYFDFFYINDLRILIEHYLDNPPQKYEEINAVYNEKKKLTDIINMISSIGGVKASVNIGENKINKNYFASGYKLAELCLPFTGLYLGIDEVYRYLKYGK